MYFLVGSGVWMLCLDEFSKDWAALTVPGGNKATQDFKPIHRTWWLRYSGEYPKQSPWLLKDTRSTTAQGFSPPVVKNTLTSEKSDLAQRLEVGRAQDISYGWLSQTGIILICEENCLSPQKLYFAPFSEKKCWALHLADCPMESNWDAFRK